MYFHALWLYAVYMTHVISQPLTIAHA